MTYYAISVGRETGIVNSWADCERLVSGYSGARFKKFGSLRDAQNFLRGGNDNSPPQRQRRAQGWPVVYTDGACSDNGRAGARAGIGVYWGEDDHRNVSERLHGRQTNNRAEIHAAIRAIQQARQDRIPRLEIRTDSHFLVRSMTEWVHTWQDKNWISSTGRPIVNRDDFEELLDVIDNMEIRWVHVAGHAGEYGNEEADRLANEGMQELY